ncbi:MmgE/PrpD family protein [Microvirga sp. VF16]|uniref:MmgE/PrpD family protein n=1 Tax=Microvirga sp. VF16 TaxID=2807101 RepID=UPI00193CAD50|nr:MmgE/PrpD family protein [Microvirga sp. VF16]QRM33103.1 MmgE/PrpD family protein [Microvirga sp. VF16]
MKNLEGPTARLTHFVHGLEWADVSPSAQAAVLNAVADNIACMVAGSRTELAAQTADVVRQWGGTPQCAVVGQSFRTSAPLASFINAVQANALDYDDAFERDGKGMGHPGSTIVPAALAAAQVAGSSGKEFLAAVVAGYEAADRVIEAIQPTPARHGQVWGVAVHQSFGAAVAAGKLLGLELTAFRNAFGLAGSLASVPAARKWNWTTRPLSSLKDVVAPAAETGVRAAILAAAGWQGSRDILDGEKGFWIMAGSDRCDFDLLTDRLGSRWTIEEVSLKPYPACRWLHAALEALEDAVADQSIRAEDILEIEVATFAEVVENFADRRPASMIDAEFSVPWGVAAIVAGLPKGPDWYSRQTLSDPRLHAIADKVTLRVDEEAQRRHFSDERKSMSAVRIRTATGWSVERRVPVACGGVSSPWPVGGLEKKFASCLEPTLGAKDAARLQHLLLGLADLKELSPVIDLIEVTDRGRPS